MVVLAEAVPGLFLKAKALIVGTEIRPYIDITGRNSPHLTYALFKPILGRRVEITIDPDGRYILITTDDE